MKKYMRKGLLLLAMALSLCLAAGAVSITQEQAVYAASKTTKLKFSDKSGKYLEKKGSFWYLKDKRGKALTGFQYVKLPEGKELRSGYYVFDSKGKMCTGKHFHKVDKTVNGHVFKGNYYFGRANGRLYQKRGWCTIGSQKYFLSSYGRRYENRWISGYYVQSNGTIARNKILPDGTRVDKNGKKIPEKQKALGPLKTKLTKMLRGYSGSWSVYVKNLESGEEFSINDRAMYPASTIKAFVMASTFDQINRGKLKYTSTVKRLLKNMITVSDNESFNQLVRYHSKSRSFVSGTKEVNKYLTKNKYTKTGCHSTLHPSSSSFTSDGKSNTASAKDCGKLLDQIYHGKCVSSAYSREMKNLLLGQTRRWKIPAGVPSGIKVANKTGETSSVQHDMAIVYGKKADYILCVFSTTGSEGYSVPRIKSISSTVYSYINK